MEAGVGHCTDGYNCRTISPVVECDRINAVGGLLGVLRFGYVALGVHLTRYILIFKLKLEGTMFQQLKAVIHVAAVLSVMAVSGIAVANPVSGQGTWESTLKGRDLNHDGINDAYYDTDLNVTWLADAYADGPPPGMPIGRPILFWSEAREWVRDLNVYGVTGWRLPSVVNDPMATDIGYRHCPVETLDGSSHGLCGFNSDPGQSELAHMFYVTLGNKALIAVDGAPQLGAGLTNTGWFNDLQPTHYWSGTKHEPGRFVWAFDTDSGLQNVTDPFGGFRSGVWAIHDGDIAAVPEPEALALLASGGLVAWMLRRRSSRALPATA
jgi:hypothetical protein